jgi:hypothetical protein
MVETKVLLTEQEDNLLVAQSKESMQSKTKFCTKVIVDHLKKSNKKGNHE